MTIAPAASAVDRPLYADASDQFAGKDLDAKIQLLADREAIRDLVSIYAHRVAQGGISVSDLFTDDGAFINRIGTAKPVTELRGRKALDKFYGDLSRTPGIALPMLHNHLIQVNGDDATGLVSIEVRTSNNGTSIIASGFYKDIYRRENGRWKFVVRDCTFFHSVPLQQGWAERRGGE